jgi:hypothetical protein
VHAHRAEVRTADAAELQEIPFILRDGHVMEARGRVRGPRGRVRSPWPSGQPWRVRERFAPSQVTR